MKPPIHAITSTSGGTVPSLVVFIDTESLSGKGACQGETIESWRLGVGVTLRRESGVWSRRELRRFTSSRDLWDWVHSLESRRRPVWLFAHNLGFDLTISDFWSVMDSGRYSTRDIWPRMDLGDFTSGKARREWRGTVVLSDPPTMLVLRSKKGSLRLVDTCNYYFGPLADLGQSVGLPQLASPDRDATDDEWFLRCERDATILEQSVCGWIDEWAKLECGCWRPTAAGLGYSAWRSTLKDKKVIPDQSEKQIEFARGSYYGGQTEVFYRGSVWPGWQEMMKTFGFIGQGYEDALKGPVWHLDVHALYPSVMKANVYPKRFIGYSGASEPSALESKAKFLLPISRVQIATIDETYPVRLKGKYLHATGEFSTFLCGNELLAAIRRGHVTWVHETAWYEPADLFSEFCQLWLDRRAAAKARSDKAGEMLDKLIVNSLSGKFAQRKAVWIDRPELAPMHRFGQWNTWHAQTREFKQWRAIGGCVQEHTGLGEGRDSFPAISAHITANGREVMRELRAHCPVRSVLYQDTDSLMVLEPGFQALDAADAISDGIPGKLAVKSKWSWCEIMGFKFYASPDGVVCPGLKKDAREDMPGIWHQTRFQRLASILAQYSTPQVVVTDHHITVVGSLGNRVATEAGWTVAPRVDTSLVPF